MQQVKKISKAHIFETTLTRQATQGRMIDELLRQFRGSMQPVMAHLVETGNLTLEDVREAERLRREMPTEEKPSNLASGK